MARVEAGELKPNVDHNKNLIALGDREPNVSAGGNDIVVDETDEGTYVLFLTSRGLKHYFTGFLHVPPGGDPKKFFEFEDKPPSQLVRYDEAGTSWRTSSNQFHAQMPSDCLRGARQRTKRHGLVFGIEQAIELSTACLHARGELGLGNLLTPHQFVELPHQHALDRARGYALVDSVLFQEFIERRSNSALLAMLLSSCDLLLSLDRQFQITGGRLLCLLDEGMQQYHSAFMFAEQHASDSPLRQCAANFPQPPPQGPAKRHADRPCEFDILDVLADDLAIIGRQILQPFPNRLTARWKGVEESGQLLHRTHVMYHFWYVPAREI